MVFGLPKDVEGRANGVDTTLLTHLGEQLLVVLFLNLGERNSHNHTVLRWQKDFIADNIFRVPQGKVTEE
jgi:hypothetical protein